MHSLTFETNVPTDHLLHLPDDLPAGILVRITVERLMDDTMTEDYQPRTDIGRLALAARKAYLADGGKLRSADEISEEVSRRRGGLYDLTTVDLEQTAKSVTIAETRENAGNGRPQAESDLIPVGDSVPPRTTLWVRLNALRNQAARKGELPAPMSWDQILAEAQHRRGEQERQP